MAIFAETAFIVLVFSSFVVLGPCLAVIYYFVPHGWVIVAALFVWALFLDQAPYNGKGRILPFLRFNWYAHHRQSLRTQAPAGSGILAYKGYFSHKLRQDAPLNPSDKHLFVCHPHGIIAFSTWLVFAGDAIHFLRNNPQLQLSIVTVKFNFLVPIWRDLLLSLGFLDASYKSIRAIFDQQRSAVLVVGGSQEALEAHPNTNRLVLNKRKGFIKLALESGVKVVPVYHFGETNMFTQVANPRGSMLRSFQEFLLRRLTFSTPLLTSGVIPMSTPILTVIGAPLSFPKIASPSVED
ncbi:hypothetical protein As57867_012257, partial [Aphanomyces stellatus]